MKILYSPKYEVDLGPHILPTAKFRLIKERLIQQGIATAGDFEEPPPARDEDILLVHTPVYLDKVRRGTLSTEELTVLDLPFSRGLAEAAWVGVEGTIRAARYALETGLGIHIGGGGHHAYPDHGAGYCVFNDSAVAIRTLQRERRIVKAMVIDCDVHQGDGTAFIFREEPSVFTCSIHQEDLYPEPKQRSDLDMGLPSGAGDEEYLAELSRQLLPAVEVFRPQLLIYVAGADPYHDDQEGGLKLTFVGLERRDQIIFQEAKRKRVPVAVVLAGGYAR
ncbi:MAG: histone deacetylase, partial [Acidobacteria bacterium]|nr:histone deacetylase [Acidobacteriota bacterium]